MHLLFRVDAGGPIGLGHFYRSIALANTLAKQNVRHTFCHAPSPFWSNTDIPFNTVALNSDDEEQHMLRLIDQEKYDALYVDGIIPFSKNFVNQVQQRSVPVVFYQNISDSRHLCDIFILPSIRHNDHFFVNFSPDTIIYKGLEYVIFNEQVYQLAHEQKLQPEKASQIGIATGGSDPQGVLLILYKLIDHHAFQDVSFTYFYGSDFLHKDQIPELPEGKVTFAPFDQLRIQSMDVIISTFGVSTYEFMYQGLPILSVGHQAANAEASRKVAEQTHGLIDLGLIDDLSMSQLNYTLKQIIIDVKQRTALSENAIQAIDAQGRDRVARILTSLAD